MIPLASLPPTSQTPKTRAPDGACDAHVHLLAAPDEFPLWAGRVEDPAPGLDFDGYLDHYRAHLDTLGFMRGLIVHSILYGTDNSVTFAAVRRLGDNFRGVGLLPDDATPAQLDDFAKRNMVAVRLNYVHGGVLSWAGVRAMAPALADRGLHIQMLLNTHKHMADIANDIAALPCPLVIDHLGWPDLSRGIDDPGFQALLRLAGTGRVHVKLSALYRLCDAPYSQAAPFVAALVHANPAACLWGSDWPHIMLGDATMPHANCLLDAFHDVVTSDADRSQILVTNPDRLFFS